MALNILIVDDSATVRAVLRKVLQNAEIPMDRLFEASNGKEALDLLKDQWVDLVFTDLNMPVMDGVELIERLSEDGIMESIPVVIISTEGSSHRIEALMEKGVRGYVRKPFTPEAISQALCDVLGMDTRGSREAVLGQVFCDVLEKLAYLFAEPISRNRVPSAQGPCIQVTIEFKGPLEGVLSMAVPETICEELAASILGLEPEDPLSRQHACDALKEVLNVTCGHLLTSIEGREPVFHVSPPELSELDDIGWSTYLVDPSTTGFLVEEQPVLLRMSLFN